MELNYTIQNGHGQAVKINMGKQLKFPGARLL